ncbi:MAG: GNAT family N-acetyltransferase [Planctomycetaceae bacterium]|nr:GNAT family N-acetyltransferase [Planctomycetaceae bacterium]
MSKTIGDILAQPTTPGYSLRTFAGPADSYAWLALRTAAFAGETPTTGIWNQAHFQREFTDQWWWRPEWQWFASESTAPDRVVGSVTLALRGTPEQHVAVVHWLMVLPENRRHGIARALLATLEQTAYQAGYRELRLETHVNWRSAVRFYESAGYRPIEK